MLGMWKRNEILDIAVALLFLIVVSGPTFICAATFGINYGKVANDLLAPAEVVNLIQSISFTKAKIYDPDPLVLKTFSNTDISFQVGVRNEDLANLTKLSAARAWVNDNVLAYHPTTNIIGIVVGNEIFGGGDTTMMNSVVPAMENIYTVLGSHGLQKKIMISTTHSFAVLASSYPPSSGAFTQSLTTYMKQILAFHHKTGSPFMINAYPFFAYKDNPTTISLDYVLFRTNAGVVDSKSGHTYYNMFDAQLDAVYSAMVAVGYPNVSILVSETGWPSAGDSNEIGANVQNAQIYHTNLFRHLQSNPGTPLRPNVSFDVYLFALFNENLKPGPKSEKHYGLFKPDGTRVYGFNFSTSQSLSLYQGLSWVPITGFVIFITFCLIG